MNDDPTKTTGGNNCVKSADGVRQEVSDDEIRQAIVRHRKLMEELGCRVISTESI